MSDADEPDGDEAEAQREETLMPWIWGAIGLLLIAAFVAWMILWRTPHHPPPQPQMPAAGRPAPKAP